MLVIHRNADSESRLFLPDSTALMDFAEQAGALDLPILAIVTEACTSNLAIELCLHQHKCLIASVTL